MTRWLIKWKATQQLYSLPSAERVKLSFSLQEMTKADMDAGWVKDWGVYAGGGEGYAIGEGSEKDLYEASLKYAPYISFEVIPVVPLGQVAEIMQKLAAARR